MLLQTPSYSDHVFAMQESSGELQLWETTRAAASGISDLGLLTNALQIGARVLFFRSNSPTIAQVVLSVRQCL